MVTWLITVVIREVETNGEPFPFSKLEYSTFVEDYYQIASSLEEACLMAEEHFYEKYGTDVEVIVVNAVPINSVDSL